MDTQARWRRRHLTLSAYGTGLVCHQPAASRGTTVSAYSPRALTGGPSGTSAIRQSNNERGRVDRSQSPSRRCHCHEPRVARSLFRWLSAADSWARCLRRPPLFFNPLISAKSRRDFISLSHAVSRQSFLPASAFLTRCFTALGVSQCSSSFVFPNTVSRGCCAVFNAILSNRLLMKQSREEMLFCFRFFLQVVRRSALAHSGRTLEPLRLFLEYVGYLQSRHNDPDGT